MLTIETWRVSIADSCTFQRVAILMIVDQPLAAGFIHINTRQQRASLPFKPGVLEGTVYNNDDKAFFFLILTLAKPECDNELQPEPLAKPECHNVLESLQPLQCIITPGLGER